MRNLKLTHVIFILWGVCFFKLPIGICQANTDSLGIKLLIEVTNLRKEKKIEEANKTALLAIDFFREKEDWIHWAEAYEAIYYNARKADTPSDLISAREQFEQAEEKLKQDFEFPDKTKAKIYGRIAYLYHNLGQYWEAINYYKKAFKVAENANDNAFLLRLYSSAANAFWFIGDDEKSVNFHEKALAMAYKEEEGVEVIQFILMNLGNAWRTIDVVKSIPIYQKALQINPNASEANMLLSKAYVDEDADNGKQALRFAQKALDLAEVDYEKSEALNQLGRVFFFLGDYDQALAYYDRALIFAKKSYGENHPECVKIYYFKGDAYLGKNDFSSSQEAYNKVLDRLLPLFNPISKDQHPNKEDLTKTSLWILEALEGKSYTYEKKYKQDGNIENLENALSVAELMVFYLQKMKLKYGDDESKYEVNNEYFFMCGKAIEFAFDLEKITGDAQYLENAFDIGAQTKAIVLAETLHRKELKKLSGISDSLLNLEKEFHANIAYREKKIFERRDSLFIQKQKDSLFFAKRKLEDLENQIEESFPNYAKAKFNYSQQTIPDIQSELSESTALIEYFLTDSTIFSFLITKDNFWAISKPRPADLNQKITSFLRTTSDWKYVEDSSSVASQLFLEHSWSLYQELLEEPLQLVDVENLIIIPDEVLSSISFEALLSQPYQGNWIDRDIPYLLKDYTISYRFSSIFSPLSNHESMDDWGGFGLEFNTPKDVEYLQGEEDVIALRNQGRLLHAADEVLNSADFFGGRTWLNEQATRENFLENAEEFEILHLATHAVINQKDPLRSKIIFSKSIVDEDSAVYAHEIYGMQLKAGLTVLSACSSGKGTWKRGEGMMSLARAFAYAGCPSVIMSLWNVSDKSTSTLMIDFYKNLKENKSKDEALRLSKLNYLKSTSSEYSKPIYWASFVAVGDVSPILKTNDFWPLYYWGIFFLIIIIVSYFIFSRIN